MKKFLLLLLVISNIAIAQVSFNVHVTKNHKPIHDTLANVYVENVGYKLKFSVNVQNNTTIQLQQDQEYFITFTHDSCISKVIYINTSDIRPNEQYKINTVIELPKGDKSKVIKAGTMWYDKSIDNFTYKVTSGILINKQFQY